MVNQKRARVDDDIKCDILEVEWASKQQMVDKVDALTDELKRMDEKNTRLKDEKNQYLKLLEELLEVDARYKAVQTSLIQKIEVFYEKKQ